MAKLFNAKNLIIKGNDIKINLESKHETFLVMYKGQCRAVLNNTEFVDIGEKVVYIIANNETEIVLKAQDAECWLLDFHRDVFPHFFLKVNSYFKINQLLYIEDASCFEHMLHICEMVDFELRKDVHDFEILQSLIESFFSIYYNESKKQTNLDFPTKSNAHIDKLLELIEENYRLNHLLEFYASNLLITEKQLNNLSNKYFNRTISSLVTERKIIEAQKELISTQKTISEIGYDLGFNEKSYFSRVFKKITGKTPSQYQDTYHTKR